MNLEELYQKKPVGQHHNIKVSGDKVFVKTEDGSVDEYLLDPSPQVKDELWFVKSDKEIKDRLARLELEVKAIKIAVEKPLS